VFPVGKHALHERRTRIPRRETQPPTLTGIRFTDVPLSIMVVGYLSLCPEALIYYDDSIRQINHAVAVHVSCCFVEAILLLSERVIDNHDGICQVGGIVAVHVAGL